MKSLRVFCHEYIGVPNVPLLWTFIYHLRRIRVRCLLDVNVFLNHQH